MKMSLMAELLLALKDRLCIRRHNQHRMCRCLENQKTTYTSEFVVLTTVNAKFTVTWNAPSCCLVDKFQGL